MKWKGSRLLSRLVAEFDKPSHPSSVLKHSHPTSVTLAELSSCSAEASPDPSTPTWHQGQPSSSPPPLFPSLFGSDQQQHSMRLKEGEISVLQPPSCTSSSSLYRSKRVAGQCFRPKHGSIHFPLSQEQSSSVRAEPAATAAFNNSGGGPSSLLCSVPLPLSLGHLPPFLSWRPAVKAHLLFPCLGFQLQDRAWLLVFPLVPFIHLDYVRWLGWSLLGACWWSGSSVGVGLCWGWGIS